MKQLKPNFSLKLIPKSNLYLGLLIFFISSFVFSLLFQGLFFSFYSSVVFSQVLVLNEYVVDSLTLKMISWSFSSLGIVMASFFAHQLWFGKLLTNKNYKANYSYLTYSQKDVLWGSISFLVRLTITILTVSIPIQFQIMGKELAIIFILNFIVLVLKENNHLKQAYKVSWKYDFYKFIIYAVFSIVVAFVSFPYLNEINQKLENKTLRSMFGIELPQSKSFNYQYCGCDSYYFYKKENQFFISDLESTIEINDLPQLIYQNSDKKKYFCYKETFFIDKQTPMVDVEKLMAKYYQLGNNRLLFGVKPEFYRAVCTQFYFINDYQIIRKGQTNKISTKNGNLLQFENIPPPPPPPPSFLNFDNYTVDGYPFVHLHLSKNKEYYWNDTLMIKNELYNNIFKTIGSDKLLFISYDSNINFNSVVNILDYLSEVRDNKIAQFEKENNYDLSYLQFNLPILYDSIIDNFNLKKFVLNGFYLSEKE